MAKITDYLPGQTPLREEDLRGLIPSHVTLRRELDEFEADNISHAVEKYFLGKGSKLDPTYPEDLKKLHRDMFGNTWKWAGNFRQHDTSPIGVLWQQIPVQMSQACANFRYWIENKIFDPVEIAVRFHHRLIWIHPFPNGNGRWGRVVADLVIHHSGLSALDWEDTNSIASEEWRKRYLEAMRMADQGDFKMICRFATGKKMRGG